MSTDVRLQRQTGYSRRKIGYGRVGSTRTIRVLVSLRAVSPALGNPRDMPIIRAGDWDRVHDGPENRPVTWRVQETRKSLA